jgi:hypothetical protein
MAIIKSGDSSDQAIVDPISKSIRVTNYSSSGIEGFQSLPILVATTDVSAVNDDLIASLDVAEYKFISLQLTGTWEATVTFQGSNNGGTFYNIVTSNPSGGQAVGESSTTVNRLVKIPTIYKFVRVRVTAYTSGIVESVAYGHRDENSSGLIAAIGPVTLNAETTKKIGNVGLEAGANQIGSVIIAPNPITMETDMYVGLASDPLLNARNIKNEPTTLRSIVFTNLAATPRYLKIYDTAGVPTAGAGAPVLLVSLPAVGTLAFPLPSEGFVFANGIGMTMTLGPANSNTTNTATVDFSVVSVFYA